MSSSDSSSEDYEDYEECEDYEEEEEYEDYEEEDEDEDGEATSSADEDYKQVVEAVKEGNKEAKTKLARYLLSGYGGAQIDEDRAFDILNERVKDGDAEAMWMLGLCYEYGMGCEISDKEIETLYKRCREGGNAIGEFFEENGEGNERESGVMKVKSLLMKEN